MPIEHRYEQPDRFVVGTVGRPGERTFFVQARQGRRLTSVVAEKQQVEVLAEHLDRVLDELSRLTSGAVAVPPRREEVVDAEPLDAPIEEEFRIGTMTIAWDPNRERIVIEMFPMSDAEVPDDADAAEAAAAETAEASEIFVVSLLPGAARDFVARSRAVVRSGRPACPFCQQPIDPDGHICPRANGYRRPLFGGAFGDARGDA